MFFMLPLSQIFRLSHQVEDTFGRLTDVCIYMKSDLLAKLQVCVIGAPFLRRISAFQLNPHSLPENRDDVACHRLSMYAENRDKCLHCTYLKHVLMRLKLV